MLLQRRWFLILTIFLAANVLAVCFSFWRRSTKARPPSNQAVDARRRQAEVTANEWISEWNAGKPVSIESAELLPAVASMPSQDCMSVQSGGSIVPIGELSPDQLDDLNAAIVDLLRAYEGGTAERVIEYMRSRGQVFDEGKREVLEKGMKQQGESGFEQLSNTDLYARLWRARNCASRWTALVAESSCRQTWNGSALPVQDLSRFDLRESKDPAGPAVSIGRVMNGASSNLHYFKAAQGSLEDELGSDGLVLVSDVKLILVYSQDEYELRAPYLVRFWYNRVAAKWQPICLLAFASHPQKATFPRIMF